MTEESQDRTGDDSEPEQIQPSSQDGVGERRDPETVELPQDSAGNGSEPVHVRPSPQDGAGERSEPETVQLPPQGWAAAYLEQSPEPPAPPQPVVPADRWRAAAVGLLNLSGLALGYALMRRWRPAILGWLATGILVLIALPATPSGISGAVLVIYLMVLVLMAVHGAVRGLRTPLAWPPRSQLAAGLAVVLLVVPVGAAALFNNAQQEAVQRMLLNRLQQADQTIAAAESDPISTAEPIYTSALSTYQDLLDNHRTSRAGKLVPDRLATFYQAVGGKPFSAGDYCGAIEPLTFLRSLPVTTISAADLGSLATWPDDRLATSLYQCGVKALGTSGDTTATTNLNQLLAMFPKSAQAGQVEPAVAGAIKTAAGGITGSDPCAATTGLTTLSSQVSALTSNNNAAIDAGLKKDTATVNADVESGTFDCNVSEYKNGKFSDAQTAMDSFATTYPNDPNKALAQKYSIAAQIAEQDADAGKVIPTLASGGSVSITILNDSPDPIVMLYTGPATGSINIGACSSCKVYASQSEGQASACTAGTDYPSATISVPPGTTYFLQKDSDVTVNSTVHSESYDADSAYQACAYETNAFGL